MVIGGLLLAFRKRLAEPNISHSLGHLYNCYRPDGPSWLRFYEMAIFARRLALALLISVVRTDSPYRATAIVFVLLVAYFLQRWLRPFIADHDNKLEEVAILIVLFTFVSQTLWADFNILDSVAGYQISMVANADLMGYKEDHGGLIVILAMLINGLFLATLLGFLVWPLLTFVWQRAKQRLCSDPNVPQFCLQAGTAWMYIT